MHKSIDKPTNMYQKTFSGVLSDITLGMINNYFCSLSLGTVDGDKIEKKCYDTTKISATFMNKNFNSAVPIELRGYQASASGWSSWVWGFEMKLDNGDVRTWGMLRKTLASGWQVFGGPIIGIINDQWPTSRQLYVKKFGFVIGNECRPKYFGSQTISLREGAKIHITFFWQDSYDTFFQLCNSEGYGAVSNPQVIDWVTVLLNLVEVEVQTLTENIYSTS